MTRLRNPASRTGMRILTTLLLIGAVPLLSLSVEAHANHKGIIMVLDYGLDAISYNHAENALAKAGYVKCNSGSIHPWNCYDMVTPTDYQKNSCAILSQADRRVLLVPSRPTADAFGVLYQCRTPLKAAVANGLCVVALEEVNRQPDNYDWIPLGVYPTVPDAHVLHADGVDLTNPGLSHIATSGTVWTNWGSTYHEYFTSTNILANFPAGTQVLATVKGDSTKALIFAYEHGAGGVLVSSIHADQHIAKTSATPADAVQFVKQSVEWALECSCDKPTDKPDHVVGTYLPEGVNTVHHEVTEGVVEETLFPTVGGILDQTAPETLSIGAAYITRDGAVHLEDNGIGGLQRWQENIVYEAGQVIPVGPRPDTRIALGTGTPAAFVGQGEACGIPTTLVTLDTPVGAMYIEDRGEDGLAPVSGDTWVYRESNGKPGLQRGGVSPGGYRDTCSDEGPPDDLLY